MDGYQNHLYKFNFNEVHWSYIEPPPPPPRRFELITITSLLSVRLEVAITVGEVGIKGCSPAEIHKSVF